MAFKVGDYVKAAKVLGKKGTKAYISKGTKGVISRVRDDGDYGVIFDSVPYTVVTVKAKDIK